MNGVEAPPLPTGLAPSDWSIMRESIDAHRHAIEASHHGFEANNPRFNWRARFDGRSALIEPAARDWSFGLALNSFGFDGETRQLESPAFEPCVDGQEVTYGWSAELSEWWINDRRGFEHGFTVHSRPARVSSERTSPLVFELDALGSLEPRVNESRSGLGLYDSTGASVLRYDGLVAFDANGTRLSAWIELDERRVRICVDEALAQYPVTVDPIVQEVYIKPSLTGPGDQFGFSIAASGDTVVVGAPREDSNATGVNSNPINNSATFAGAAYVFVRAGPTWIQEAYLKASNTGSFDEFGGSVAVSGDIIVVGAVSEDSSSTGVDGAQSDDSAFRSGAAYVFARSGSTWTQEAYLKASNTDAQDEFGFAVAASGDTVVVGARWEDSGASGIDGDQLNNAVGQSGAAYVFVRSGSTWSQEAYVKPSNPDLSDSFGSSVAVSGDTMLIGAPLERSNATGVNGGQSDNSGFGSGAAYVFTRSGSTWTQEAYLKASNTDPGDLFGNSVALSVDTAVVGAPMESSGATGVDGDQLSNTADSAGAAYVFARSGSTWSQQAYLKASNTGDDDGFGGSVAAFGDTVVVGARGEDSNATSGAGNQSNNSASAAGAAYGFARSGSSWSQEFYLKASNASEDDLFGHAVGAAAGTIVVGAFGEDSSATGVNGDQANDSALSSGAIYCFLRDEGVGTPYCMAAVNSSGSAGLLEGNGSVSVAANDLTLVATNIPVDSFGLFLTSTVQGFVSNPGGSDGNLCLGGSIGRYVGPNQVKQAGETGSISLLIDLTSTPQPTGTVSISPGETWNFQGWYRDVNMTGPTSNLTNGLEVSFTM